MTPVVSEDYLQERKNHIMEAAWRCFAQKGFGKTTMRDIGKAAKLSPGTVYRYFRGKDDIMTAIAEMSLERNVKMITSAAQKDDKDPIGSVLEAFFSMLKGISRQPDANKFLSVDFEIWSEASRNKLFADLLYQTQESTLTQVARLVESQQQSGKINRSLDSQAVARVLLALLLGLQIHFAANPKTDIDAYTAACSALIHGEFAEAEGNHKRKERKGNAS